LDRKKVRKPSHAAPAVPPGAAGIPSSPAPDSAKVPPSTWRRLLPYFFMGAVFLLGAFSLWLVILGNLALAGRVVLAAIVLASMEYHVRRFSAGPSSMEHEFSALSDMFCFAVVPGFLVYRLAFRGWGILGLMGLFAIVFAGLIRLSLFKLYNPVNAKRHLVGIPLSINAGFIALIAQLAAPQSLLPIHRLGLLCAVLALSFLTVSTIPYPNPADSPGILILAALLVVAIFVGPPITLVAVTLLLGGGVLYILLAPFWAKKGANARA